MLLSFWCLIMLGLRNYLLPQLDGQESSYPAINHLPQIFVEQLCFSCLSFKWLSFYRKSSKIRFQQTSSSAIYWTFGTGLLDRLLCSWMEISVGRSLGTESDFAIMQEQPSQLFKKSEDMAAALQGRGELCGWWSGARKTKTKTRCA